ncbi:DoxX family protein [Corynebacterium bovis]|uniref:DoxX family protein n=1 Tax=Corynebacterium bovis TaxID=36808 RepID=A0A426PYN5_9CORY|nr:DoxX family protein [Corynebacterium bovis]MDN8579555.1 DoxX family protein [Corynebacterium bovis]RRO86387.1 hypothetical protein CXF48_07205 [Corynebacterium bovis]RRO89192.1 hypothetical protein CXF30_03900 [Corynebacterium bovis]
MFCSKNAKTTKTSTDAKAKGEGKDDGASTGSTSVARLGRLALSPIFLVGGQSAFSNAKAMAPMIEQKAKQVGLSNLPVPAETLIKVNGAGMMVLGTALGLGIAKKPAALGLVLSLIPTTLAGHAFWEEESEGDKKGQLIHFLKNTGLIGGLLAVASR